MNGWAVALLIILVLGVLVSNLMLLKHTAKMKVPKEILDAIQKKKDKALQKKKEKKPKDK
ncbi:MAG TPA: DUF2897 family protein [Psychromonas sp.]